MAATSASTGGAVHELVAGLVLHAAARRRLDLSARRRRRQTSCAPLPTRTPAAPRIFDETAQYMNTYVQYSLVFTLGLLW